MQLPAVVNALPAQSQAQSQNFWSGIGAGISNTLEAVVNNAVALTGLYATSELFGEVNQSVQNNGLGGQTQQPAQQQQAQGGLPDWVIPAGIGLVALLVLIVALRG